MRFESKEAAGDGGRSEEGRSEEMGRRHFMMGAAAGVLAGWLPAFRVSPASAQATCAPPPNFPDGIAVYQQAYQNWSGEIQISALWTCAPQNTSDVLTIVNWAHQNGYKARPRGMMHNWSPLTVSPAATCASNVVLLDTTAHLTAVSIDTATNTVTAQTGVTMEALLTALENAGLGVTATPAPGDVTLGGCWRSVVMARPFRLSESNRRRAIPTGHLAT